MAVKRYSWRIDPERAIRRKVRPRTMASAAGRVFGLRVRRKRAADPKVRRYGRSWRFRRAAGKAGWATAWAAIAISAALYLVTSGS
jgi:hypothetical protein